MIRISNRIKEKESNKINEIITLLNNNIQELNNNTNNINYLLLIKIYTIFIDNYDLMARHKFIITKINRDTLIDTAKHYINYINTNNSCLDNKIYNKFKKIYLKFLFHFLNYKITLTI